MTVGVGVGVTVGVGRGLGVTVGVGLGVGVTVGVGVGVTVGVGVGVTVGVGVAVGCGVTGLEVLLPDDCAGVGVGEFIDGSVPVTTTATSNTWTPTGRSESGMPAGVEKNTGCGWMMPSPKNGIEKSLVCSVVVGPERVLN